MRKIAIVQETPVLLNRQKSIAKAVSFVAQAAASGAKIERRKLDAASS